MHNPTLIPTLLKDTSINKGFIYRELQKALPCRIGLEFEMGANFRVGFQKKYSNPKATDKDIAEYYRVLEIRCDNKVVSYEQALNRNRREHCNRVTMINNDVDELYNPRDDGDTIIETRISIKDYSQLAGLYRFMQDLPEFCTLHEGGGIHIHIDMSMFEYVEKPKEKEIKQWLTHRLNEIESLFPKYTGKYNKKRIGLREKSTWLNMSAKHTLEFRILPLTFDYYTLMTWIVRVVKFRAKLIHECRLRKDWASKRFKVVLNSLIDSDLGSTELTSERRNGNSVEFITDLNGSTYEIRPLNTTSNFISTRYYT